MLTMCGILGSFYFVCSFSFDWVLSFFGGFLPKIQILLCLCNKYNVHSMAAFNIAKFGSNISILKLVVSPYVFSK